MRCHDSLTVRLRDESINVRGQGRERKLEAKYIQPAPVLLPYEWLGQRKRNVLRTKRRREGRVTARWQWRG